MVKLKATAKAFLLRILRILMLRVERETGDQGTSKEKDAGKRMFGDILMFSFSS